MRGKKGFAHFEMMIGFIFFMGFVSFLFIYVNPWSNSSLPKSGVDRLYDSFNERVKTNLSSVFIGANLSNVSAGATCFSIDLPVDLFKYGTVGRNSLVTVLGGDGLDSSLDSGNLNVDKKEFFRVAISPEFDSGSLSSCEYLEDFDMGGVVELEVVSNKSLTEIKDKYYNDYEGLKKELKVADIFNFAIVPDKLPELVMEPANGVPDSVDVVARDYVVKVLTSEGYISNERLSFRLW